MAFAHHFAVKRFALTACLICLPLSASAQSLTPPVVTFVTAASADWLTTYHGLSADHATEADRLYAPAHSQPTPTILMGAMIDAFAVAGVCKIVRHYEPQHPRIRRYAVVGLYAASAVRAGFAIYNLKQHRQAGYSW